MYFAIVKKEGETSKCQSCKYIRKNKNLKVCKPYLE